MARVFTVPLRYVVVTSFPSSPSQGDCVVLSSDGHLYCYSGSAWVDCGQGGVTQAQVLARAFGGG
jgi:hypothetical protein